MYQEFYGLTENPFSLSPDPQYLYLTPRYKEAMAQLFYGVWERKGFMVLIGEVGTGKTLLLNWMLNMFAENNILSAYIFNPVMTATDMFEYISADFGLECNAGSKSQFLMQLYSLLIDLFGRAKTAVLIIDEAQNLSFEILEELRMLSNLETGKQKLLQIVLAGQPELGVKLNHPAMRQLKQRVALRCMLKPLTLVETQDYIYTHLVIAGLKSPSLFNNDAVDKIHSLSGGIPRIINNICDNALLAGYAYNKPIIDKAIIGEVADDLQLVEAIPVVKTDPIFILTTPDAAIATTNEQANKIAESALAHPSWIAFLSDLMRRFTGFRATKARSH